MNRPAGAQPDPALLELFQAEMDAHIPVLSEGLLALEKGQAGEQDVAAMMRAAHSIKGAARIVGVEAAVRIAHVMEDCFQAARQGRVTLSGAAVDTLLEGVDALQRICAPHSDSAQMESELASLQERIAAVRDGRAPADGARKQPPDVGAAVSAAIDRAPADGARVALPADFDDAAAERLRGQLCEALGRAAPRLCLDCSRVGRVSAGALALLSSLARDAERAGSAVAFEGAAGPIAALFRVAGLDRAWASRP